MIVDIDKKGNITVSSKWLAGHYRDGALEYKRDAQNPQIWRLYMYGILKECGTWNDCLKRAKFE